MAKSMAEIVAAMSDEERAAALEGIDPEELLYDGKFWLRPEQKTPAGGWNIHLVLAGRGWGKALALDTVIIAADPWRWTTMGELQDGDTVLDDAGRKCTVVKAHEPIMPETMYRIQFSTGEIIKAGGEHLWTTWTHAQRSAGPFVADWAQHGQVIDTDTLYATQHDLHAVGKAGTIYPEGGWNHITAIAPIEPEESRCITVDSPSRLYLVGDTFIATHNTRAATEFIKEQALSRPGTRIAGVTRVAADGRDVLVEGASGLMAIHHPDDRPDYSPTKRRITWPNGSTCTLYTSEEPSLLRGPQFHAAVGDEVAAWRNTPDDSGLTAWDNLKIATRLGEHPRILLTTTPKRVPLLYELIRRSEDGSGEVIVTRGSTKDNSANLSKAYLDSIYGTYEGSRLASQELDGEMLDEIEDAIWTYESIQEAHTDAVSRDMVLRVVGVDPSVAQEPNDECGIVVVGSTMEPDLHRRRAWVLEDASLKASPEEWARRVVDMAKKYKCPVVAETNQGGDLVRMAVNQVDPSIKVYTVHSMKGKALRAEPIAMAYDQGRVKHYGVHADLEAQMMAWVPGDRKSPDRIDALVHGLSALLVKPAKGMAGGGVTARNITAGRRVDIRAARTARGRVW